MQQIADWLEKLGMSEYAQRFAENRIDFSVLPELPIRIWRSSALFWAIVAKCSAQFASLLMSLQHFRGKRANPKKAAVWRVPGSQKRQPFTSWSLLAIISPTETSVAPP
jgi:SAM domain (Sterile alpha motif)